MMVLYLFLTISISISILICFARVAHTPCRMFMEDMKIQLKSMRFKKRTVLLKCNVANKTQPTIFSEFIYIFINVLQKC